MTDMHMRTPLRSFDRLSIEQLLVGAVVLILVLFGLACLVNIATFQDVNEARAVADRVNSSLVRAGDLSDALNGQESALRAYTLVALPRFLDTLSQVQEQFASVMDTLQEASVELPFQARRLQVIEGLERRWRKEVAKPIVAQVKAGEVGAARDRLIAGDSIAILDPMHEKLDEFRADIQDQLDRSDAALGYSQWRARWSLIGVLIFGLVLGLMTVRAIVRRVTAPLGELTETTRRLAAGERDIDIGFRGRSDEIGAVARALEHFRRIILEQDRHAWIRDHRARISVGMQAQRTTQALGDLLIRELASLLGAGYGALFIHATLEEDETRFSLLSRYGYSDDVAHSVAPGQGLVGQVLVSRERIILDNLPDDYLPVTSGLGRASPSVLLLVPAIVSGHVMAVLEVALFRSPSDTELELLDTLLPNVALAFISLGRTQRATDLLAQSRAKTEELERSEQRMRDQQAALHKVNRELRAQSKKLNEQSEALRVSEEELTVQSDKLQVSNEELRAKNDVMSQQKTELSHLHRESEQRANALARASRYKSEFLANMSHELRTPLNSLLILSRSLADNEGGRLDAEQVEAAQIINESGNNLLTLINDILDLSRIEAGKMPVNVEDIDVAAFVAQGERHFGPLARSKGLDFEITVADDFPAALITDAGKLQQVLRNLVTNALKFTERGGVRVAFARPQAGTVFRSEGLDADNAVAIHVSDDGIGIPEDRLEQIFEAFEQVDASTSRTYGGTGLGLSISRELARLLGGEVTVDSRVGGGSRFSVYIRETLAANDIPAGAGQAGEVDQSGGTNAGPALSAATDAAAAPAAGAHLPAAAPDLLVVDDDRDAQTALAHLFKREPWRVTAAMSGEQALAQLAAHSFDCVVVDLGLPDVTGFELIDKIVARARVPAIVVYSGRELSEDETRRLRAHTDSIVIKGSHAQERLLDEISLCLHRRAPISSSLAQPSMDAQAGPVEAQFAGETVLLVDDDMRNTFALSRLLRARGLKVLMASDGFKALDQLASHTDVAVVLMDIMMPGIDGYETTRRIRAQERHADLPIVALTAKAMAGDCADCLAAGANDYLPKPLDTDALITRLQSLIA